jgi:hypothetical protein
MLLPEVLLWVPYVSSVAWVIYFLCIMTVDDEYQLFSYLARFKVIAFVMWGMLPVVMDWFGYYFVITGGRLGTEDEICFSGGPHQAPLDRVFDICFITMHFLAYVVFAKYKYVRRQHFSGALKRTVWTGDKDHGDHEINAVVIFDVCVAVVAALGVTLDFAYRVNGGSSLADFFLEMWDVVFVHPMEAHSFAMYMSAMYTTIIGMFALPWLLLAIPGLGDMLHQMRPTGFDEAGGLKLVMTLQQMKRKQKKLAMAGRLSEQEQALLNSVCRARARTPDLGISNSRLLHASY